MVEIDIEFLASFAGSDVLEIADAKEWFGDDNRARKAVLRLGSARLLFPLARGCYALPDKGHVMDLLAMRSVHLRLASWLPDWISAEGNARYLADGLEWESARFLALALDRSSELVWEGPDLLVPIADDASRIKGLHHRVPIFAYDPGDDELVHGGAGPIPVPSRREMARVLAVHNDPRLREAAGRLSQTRDAHEGGGGHEELGVLVARTDPPMPFPDPKVKLPRGPPFRYRLYAPQSWVKRNIGYSRPATLAGEEGEVGR